MLIWMVVFIVLMVLWAAFGIWSAEPGPSRRTALGGTFIPWVCVAILGYIVFNGVPAQQQPAVIQQAPHR